MSNCSWFLFKKRIQGDRNPRPGSRFMDVAKALRKKLLDCNCKLVVRVSEV